MIALIARVALIALGSVKPYTVTKLYENVRTHSVNPPQRRDNSTEESRCLISGGMGGLLGWRPG